MSGTRRLAHMDWRGIQHRLETASRNLQSVLDVSAEHSTEAMRERTRRLAQPPDGPVAQRGPEEAVHVLRFRLGSARYGVETCYVREVTKQRQLATLPGAPPALAGIIACRGTLVPVFDLGRRPSATREPEPWLLLLGEAKIEAALRVTEVEDVVTLARHDILAPPAGASGPGNLPVSGLAPDMVLLVNGKELLGGNALRVGAHAAGVKMGELP